MVRRVEVDWNELERWLQMDWEIVVLCDRWNFEITASLGVEGWQRCCRLREISMHV